MSDVSMENSELFDCLYILHTISVRSNITQCMSVQSHPEEMSLTETRNWAKREAEVVHV